MAKALLSVYDKSGLLEFAAELKELGFDLIATGGTFQVLEKAGLKPTKVSDLSGFPEILGGRVKTLHPSIHAGILAKRTKEQLAEIEALGIEAIDMVVVNLYPFEETIKNPESSLEQIIEKIDIGGPTMIRAAAKNYKDVLVVCKPGDYDCVVKALSDNTEDAIREPLAKKAFAHTASYDAAIANWFARSQALADNYFISLKKQKSLRYGENPHQEAALYGPDDGFWAKTILHKGLALSYLNIFDSEAAWQLVNEFDKPTSVIVKHANPCGASTGETISDAYKRAFEGDPLSAFGGIVAVNRKMDAETAKRIMANPKADVIIAPSYSDEALSFLKAKRKNMRVLEVAEALATDLEIKQVGTSYLLQTRDKITANRNLWRVVSDAKPSEAQWQDLEMAFILAGYAKSNAIVLVKDRQVVGIGAGQQSRVDAVEISTKKAGARAKGSSLSSDAFFPFRDGLDAAAKAGVTAVIQPGGSVRDDELIQAANEHGMAMVFTGERHFRH